MFSRLIRSRLRLEALEDRRVPATYTVTTTAAEGAGSLRQAILDANANPGLDRIEFDVNGGGVQVIDGRAPDITDPVDLDARTQPGFVGMPLIVVTSFGTASALNLVDHHGSSVRGLCFQDAQSGFADDRYMIRLIRGGSHTIQGNFLGTDVTGTLLAFLGSFGIRVDRSDDNQIGGTAVEQRNLIGVRAWGVDIFGGSRNVIEGNFFGSDITGLRVISEAAPLELRYSDIEHPYTGVLINAATSAPALNNRIGGTAPGAGNLFRDTIGVSLNGATQGTSILGNTFTLVPQAAIAHVQVTDFESTLVAPNDPLDADSGPNGLQNFPVLSSVVLAGGAATVTGTLSSSANTTFRVELHVNARADITSLGGGQGTFAAAAAVTTNAAGTASFSVTVPNVAAGSFVAATATNLATGDTSTFSEPVKAVAGTAVTRRGQPEYAVAAGSGGGPRVRVYNLDGSLRFDFLAYEATFRGGARVALGDVTGDGVNDIVTGTGPGGGPLVKVFDGVTGALVRAFFAYDAAFRGGVNVAAGRAQLTDTTASFEGVVVTGPGAGGGPHVKVFRGDGTVARQFFAYDASFRGGVTVALQGVETLRSYRPLFYHATHIVVGPGPGMAPLVRRFELVTGVRTTEFLAFDASFRGGVGVAVTGSHGLSDASLIYVVPGPGGGPVVRGFNTQTTGQFFEFLAFDAADRGGLTITRADVNRDGDLELVVGSGTGRPSRVRAFKNPFGTSASVVADFAPFEPAFQGGVFVG